MSAERPLRFRTLAFGDLDAGLWGFVLATGETPAAVAHIGPIEAAEPDQPRALTLDGPSIEEPWQLSAAGVQLTVTPTAPTAPLRAMNHGLDGAAQLCGVQGRLLVAGGERELDCVGQRGMLSLDAGLDGLESLRELGAWFAPDEGLALVSLRPRRAAGHDEDAVACIVFEQGIPLAIDDARLSSTYTRGGSPSGASLELWLEEALPEPEPEESEQSAARHFPRRAAGESIGARAQLSLAALDVHAELFRWHARGLEGLGVYALVRPS